MDVDFFRFDMDFDLEDLELDTWSVKKVYGRRVLETIETITRKTKEYLDRPEVAGKLGRCARALVDRQI